MATGEDRLASPRQFQASRVIAQQIVRRFAQPVIARRRDRLADVVIDLGIRADLADHGLPVAQQIGDTHDLEDRGRIEMQVQHEFCPRDQLIAHGAADPGLHMDAKPGLAERHQDRDGAR